MNSIFAVSKRISLKYISALIVLLFIGVHTGHAQIQPATSAKDSVRMIDSFRTEQQLKNSLLLQSQKAISRAADSLRAMHQNTRRRQIMTSTQEVLASNPYFNFDGEPQSLIARHRVFQSREGIFYFVVSLVLYLALMRLIFYKYMSTLFTLFFRATLRQQQLREQLLQAPLPALLMNIYFVVSAAAYFAFLAQHLHLPLATGFWTVLFYGILFFAGIYIGKFILLNIAGWIFGINQVADTYIFIVFLINKMLGIFLLPVIIMLAFPYPLLLPIVITLSYVLIGGMFLYRFMISFRPVRAEIKLTRLHFFLYLCAFEIAPLLLIYKVLLASVNSSL